MSHTNDFLQVLSSSRRTRNMEDVTYVVGECGRGSDSFAVTYALWISIARDRCRSIGSSVEDLSWYLLAAFSRQFVTKKCICAYSTDFQAALIYEHPACILRPAQCGVHLSPQLCFVWEDDDLGRLSAESSSMDIHRESERLGHGMHVCLS
jgi:hypothetical protein